MTVILRPYQREAVDALLSARKGTVQIPTGTGKTILAIDLIKRLKVPTAIVVPTIPLMLEWQRFLDEACIPCALFYGQKKDIEVVTVFTYQSAYREEYLPRIREFPFIILDEVHHSSADCYQDLLPAIHDAKYALGLSATVERQDQRHHLFLKELPIIFEMSIRTAEKNGYIAPLIVKGISMRLSSVEWEAYAKFTEVMQQAFKELNINSFQDLVSIQKPVAWDALRAVNNRKMLLAQAEGKPLQVRKIVKRHPEEKILIFSESIDSINKISLTLEQAGVKCGVYHSQQKQKVRRELLDAWRQGYFPVLLSVRCLEEGIDVPEVAVGIIVASGNAKRQMIQRVGRLLRPRPGKQATIYYVYALGTTEERNFRKLKKLLEVH